KDIPMTDLPPNEADIPTRVTPTVEDRTERIDVVRTDWPDAAPPVGPVGHHTRWGGGWLIFLGLLALALAVALLLLATGAFKSADNPSTPSTTSTLPIQKAPSPTSASVSPPATAIPSTIA